jgi:ADP-ribose pyrophosphatase
MIDETRRLVGRREIYAGKKISLVLDTLELSDGTFAEREVVVHRGAVALVPMVDDDHVCLVRNVRYAVRTTLWEVPAGTIDEGEHPDLTAARELVEETGFQAKKINKLREWFVSPGVMSETMHLYLCEDLTQVGSKLEADENLEPHIVPWEEAMAMVRDGRIEDAKTMLALMLVDELRRSSRNDRP